MLLNKFPFETTAPENIDFIYKQIGIDADKVENCLKLVREWLKCESYLPNDIEESLLRNFVLGCKGNLDKVKEKLEKYLIAKTKMDYLYHDRIIKDEDFVLYPYHKFMFVCPKQTAEGNRIIMFRIPQKDVTHFEHIKFAKYVCLVYDLLLSYDNSASYHFVWDASVVTPQFIAKLNFTLAKHVSELMFNIYPFRIRSAIILNYGPVMQYLMNLVKSVMSKKLTERLLYIKGEDLQNHLPKDCLPEENGGSQGKYQENSVKLLQFFKENGKWSKQSEHFQLTGPIPEDKKKSYSFEEFSMDGSFRKLTID